MVVVVGTLLSNRIYKLSINVVGLLFGTISTTLRNLMSV